MNPHLNYFYPFNNHEADHEDQLTRAFLILLRFIPMVQTIFIDQVREKMTEKSLPSIIPPLSNPDARVTSIETQVTQHKQEQGTVISILISDEEYITDHKVSFSTRDARYDGVVLYDPNWILIIENKPKVENVRDSQLNPTKEAPDVDLVETPICLSWRIILKQLSSLLERNLVHGVDAELINDFLSFIDTEFSFLNPYSSLRLCKDHKYLLNKRCSMMMKEMELGEVKSHRGWLNSIFVNSSVVRQVALSAKGDAHWELHLEMYPGNTVNQARAFYRAVKRHKLESFIKNKEAVVTPHLVCSHISTQLVWIKGENDVLNYFDYWQKNQRKIGKYQRSDFSSLVNDLSRQRMLSTKESDEIEKHFIKTNRNHINISPGFRITCSWTKKEALELEDKKELTTTIKTKIQEIMKMWQ